MSKRLAAAFSGVVALTVTGIAVAGSLLSAGSGTITLGAVDGQVAAAATAPHYAGTVTFSSAGTGRLKNPRVYVHCYQYGSLVYGEAGGASSTFTLGGGYSLWVAAGGGPAHCIADLFYFKKAGSNSEWNGNGQQEYVWLASTEFDATA